MKEHRFKIKPGHNLFLKYLYNQNIKGSTLSLSSYIIFQNMIFSLRIANLSPTKALLKFCGFSELEVLTQLNNNMELKSIIGVITGLNVLNIKKKNFIS